MKIFVTAQHPAHVHFFRPAIELLREAGHSVSVYAREKDVTRELLDAFDVPYQMLAGTADSIPALAAVQARYEYRLLREVQRYDPDVVTTIGGPGAAHVSAVTSTRSVIFTDSEHASNYLMAPFADAVCTPRTFEQNLGPRHLRYDGFHELAYLHPERFTPDREVLHDAGVDPDQPYAVVRFSDMQAHHDVGQSGFSREAARRLVESVGEQGAVYVSAEGGTLPPGADPLPVAAADVHHLLAHADVFVGDSCTMAAEAGLLGTPAVRSNSFAGDGDLSNFRLLDDHYGLVRSTPDEDDAIRLATELLSDPTARERWADNRRRLLDDTIDVTTFVATVLERMARPETGAPELAEVGARA